MISSKVLFTSLGFFAVFALSAQEASKLFIPTNFQRAVHKETRTLTGKPGIRYFQNASDYHIKASFDPSTGVLEGVETIQYSNNSPDTIKRLVVRLYPNLFKPNSFSQVSVSISDIGEGVAIKELKVNEKNYELSKIGYKGTNAFVNLQKGINPGSVSTINISWKVKLPTKTKFRFGQYDPTTYFVAYWYPQISVYDDINGWSAENFSGLQEFYNDFSNFNVELTLPKDQIAWATGELQNGRDLFTQKIYSRIEKSRTSDSLTRIITPSDYANGPVLASKGSNTWIFKASKVPDFAFGMSDHYVWDATSLVVDKKTQRRVSINSVYNKTSKASSDVAMIARKSIDRFSTDILGVPFPYPQMTVYEGGGGMEFPMMCNNGPSNNLMSRAHITAHEIFHTYFPFMVGINETLYGWMDEGLTTLMSKEIEDDFGGRSNFSFSQIYNNSMGTSSDIPLSVPSTNLNQEAYWRQTYTKGAVSYEMLRELLGADKFKSILQEFIRRWEGKHPTPTDLFNTISNVEGKDYSWFINKWFNEYGFADLFLKEVNVDAGKVKLSVGNKGTLPVPIKLKIYFKDGTSEAINQSASVWETNSSWELDRAFSKPVTKIELGGMSVVDLDGTNNVYVVKQ